MRLLTRSLTLCALALLPAAPARAQAPAVAEAAAQLPSALLPDAVAVDASPRSRSAALVITETEDTEMRRSRWTYPAIGMVAGALAGAAYGTWVMRRADDWVAPPAHLATVPAGAVLGLALGAVANLVVRR